MDAENIRRTAPRVLVILGVTLATLLSGCGGSVVTSARLERTLNQTFANLYVKQAELLGHRGVTVKSLQARAACDKGGPKVPDHGPGADWTCLLSWKDPNVPLPDGTGKFELNVHSNDCYTATGPSKLVGLLTITNTRGDDVPNPIFEFDGCFDPNGSNARIPTPGTPARLTLPSGHVTPDAAGQVAPQLACSAGAAGGCAGVLTAKLGPTTIGTVRYALAPNGKNTFPFSLPARRSTIGPKLLLTAAPVLGTAPRRSTTLSIAPR